VSIPSIAGPPMVSAPIARIELTASSKGDLIFAL
jgi:hypothetical protein